MKLTVEMSLTNSERDAEFFLYCFASLAVLFLVPFTKGEETMKRIWSKIVIAAGLLGTVALTSVPQSADAAICPRIYRPVCALTPTGARVTFANACIARSRHATILHPGKCIGGQFCNFIWIPVCAINPFSHMKQTYPNMCVAEHDNAVWLHNGPCP